MVIRGVLLVALALWTVAPAPVAASSASRPLNAHPAAATPIVPNGSWITYHRDFGRTGFDPTAPAITTVQPTPGWQLSALDGSVYAEPLVYGGVVYVATLNDTVYALNQIDGSIIWSKNVGAPQTSGWICSGLVAGILSTPVIDTAANRIYAVSELAAAGTTPPTYHLFGLDLGNSGNIVLNTPIFPSGFDWKIQQQRGALGLANGFVYIPFGGRNGDCGDNGTPYHGYVVGAPTSASTALAVYTTPGAEDGIWAAGGVAIDSTTGHVFASTGNGGCLSGAYTYDDAVIRFNNANLTDNPVDYFTPPDHHSNWDCNDEDLGSASPLIINPSLVFQAGKRGTGFLLNANSLGGIDGQLYPAGVSVSPANVCVGQQSDATFGSFAYAAPYIYLECETPSGGLGLTALSLNTATPAFSPCSTNPCAAPDWNVGGSLQFGPPIVAGGAVWVASNNNGLYAYNQSTGALIYHSSGFGVNRFVTPAEAGGQVFVPSNTVIRSFSFTSGGMVTATPASLNFNGQTPGTTSAPQTATLHNNTTSSISVTGVSFAGANPGAYVKGTDTCTGAAVASGSTCTVQVSFHPATNGAMPATLSFTDSGPGSPQTVPLNGLGAIDNQAHLYSLDGYGRIHPAGGSLALESSTGWGWNVARSLALFPDGQGGYILDGYGGLHEFGNANPVTGFAYWGGWDIGRQVVLAPWATATSPAGWTLDGYGGVHPFGGAPGITGASYWGWDIARGMVVLADSTPSSVSGYTLDGYGGVHPFGGATAVNFTGYWGGWDIAHSITLTPNASKSNPAGWVLDGYGGIHPFGSAPAVTNNSYWGWDIARGIVAWTGSGSGGWVLDGYGGIHEFGTAPAISPYSRWGWDIAVALGSCGNSTSGLRRS
jgi:centrosomal CEP192-like protein/putative pyrroloquinoline-quinone binding quinoprotein/putative pyrroloquinoline-quinone-binding quinoprotein